MKNIVTYNTPGCYQIYPQKSGNPTFNRRFFISMPVILFVFIIIFAAGSCKTCKCPAYSRLENMGMHPACCLHPANKIYHDSLLICKIQNSTEISFTFDH